MNRTEYDDKGHLDEVVTDAGMHFERLDKRRWFLSGVRSDGTEIAIWIEGRVMMVEERPVSKKREEPAMTRQHLTEDQIQRMIASDPDAPEAIENQLTQARPFTEAFPALAEAMRKNAQEADTLSSEDEDLNRLADERRAGPFVPVDLKDLD